MHKSVQGFKMVWVGCVAQQKTPTRGRCTNRCKLRDVERSSTRDSLRDKSDAPSSPSASAAQVCILSAKLLLLWKG